MLTLATFSLFLDTAVLPSSPSVSIILDHFQISFTNFYTLHLDIQRVSAADFPGLKRNFFFI